MIIFSDDGTVKTLYVGKFKDGKFEDDSGNAWKIAYSEEYGIYVHNTGAFTKNSAVHGSTKLLTQEEIDKIVSDYETEKDCKFDIRLNWKFDH